MVSFRRQLSGVECPINLPLSEHSECGRVAHDIKKDGGAVLVDASPAAGLVLITDTAPLPPQRRVNLPAGEAKEQLFISLFS